MLPALRKEVLLGLGAPGFLELSSQISTLPETNKQHKPLKNRPGPNQETIDRLPTESIFRDENVSFRCRKFSNNHKLLESVSEPHPLTQSRVPGSVGRFGM